MNKPINPVRLEIFHNRFRSIAEEMGVALKRTAFSPNIKERQDFSCGIFAGDGGLVAQAAHIPVHLGSMPLSVASAIASTSFSPGDMVLLNDPFAGGTHLPDITVVAPVFSGEEEEPCFYVANRAHHADVGGSAPGSMSLSGTIFQEGLILPPVKIWEKGQIKKDLMEVILKNVRTPSEREGDFEAQFMANLTGTRRLEELITEQGIEEVQVYSQALRDYSERLLRRTIARIPSGNYSFQDFLDDDGLGTEDIKIDLKLTIDGDEAYLDFTGSADQVQGSINAVRAITLSAVLYCFRCLLPPDTPTNDGLLRPLHVKTRRGSILDAQHPSAVAGGNVETSQRIVDVVLGALAGAIPEKIPAASQGTMNNLSVGGIDPRNNLPFTYYETLGGGMGASRGKNGEGGIHSHMTNTLNTPIEALESSYPLLVREYAFRRRSGGEGTKRGGEGLVRELELLAEAQVSILSERRRKGPYGLEGGGPGKPGENLLLREGSMEKLPGKFTRELKKGDILRVETPGGGGYGRKKV